METNSLNLNVKSDTVEKGADRLDHLARSAFSAERASKGLATSQSISAAAAGKAATATGATATATGALSTSQTVATATGARLAASQTTVGVATNTATVSAAGATTATGGMATAQVGATATTRGLTAATAGLGATLATTLAPIVALLAPLLAVKKLLGSTVELQDFQAQLKTATGSVENAGIAFEALEEFASTTPFALEQSLDAFLKLTNLGLTPSERALASYGNTASAMGKDLNQLIEAVADATTGEFERLKEFGIKARSEGERVTFTFRGVSTEIGKNAAEIEGYLTNLGENEFAGAMSDRMDTVGGQISNLGDLWNQLFRTISELGVGNVISVTIQTGIDLLSEMVDLLKSGQFEAALEGWLVGFEGWASDFESLIGLVSDTFGSEILSMLEGGQEVWTTFIDSLKLVPALVRYYIQRIGVEFVSLGQYGEIAGEAIFQGLKIYLESSVNAAVEAAKAIGNALLNPIDTFNSGGIDFGGVGEANAAGVAELGKLISDAEGELHANRQSRIDSLGDIEGQLDGSAEKIVRLRKESEDLRAAYEKEKAAKKAARLEQFGVGATGGSTGGSTGGATGGPTGGATGGPTTDGATGEFESLVAGLRKEEQAIEESYLKRLEIVRNNTAAGSKTRLELEEKLSAQYEDSLAKFGEKTIAELDIAKNGFDLQLDQLDEYYQRRKELILENETLTEEEKTELVTGLAQQRNEIVRGLELESAKQRLQIADGYFGNFAQLAQSNNKKLAGIGKAALAAQKAIAITQATIKTYESATSAYAAMATIPVVGPALGAAAAGAAIAAGLANVSAISSASTNVGSFATGGILGGQSSTGDAVTFNGNRGEVVMNFEQQRRLLNIANGGSNAGGGSGSGSGNVTIINQTSAPVEAETRVNANGDREIIIREAVNRTKAELANEAETGAGAVVPALQRNFGLRRTGTN